MARDSAHIVGAASPEQSDDALGTLATTAVEGCRSQPRILDGLCLRLLALAAVLNRFVTGSPPPGILYGRGYPRPFLNLQKQIPR